jgi:hypothetical protein
MTVQIMPARHTVTSRAVRRMIGRCALAAAAAGCLAISLSAFGADQETGYTSAIAVPSHLAPPGRRPIPAHPTEPPDAKPDRSVERSRIVDQLYEELMRWTPPACSSAATKASMVAGC